VRPACSVVIPAFNEELRIGRTLRRYATRLSGWEIIVVLNGCTDRSAQIAKAAAADHPGIRIVEIGARAGKGGALARGLGLARGDVVAFTDADGATDPAELARLCDLVGPADAVVGSRWLPGADVVVPQPLIRRAASRVFNLLVRVLFGLRFTDTQCGAKAFRAQTLHSILPEVETANYAFDVDLLLALQRSGASVVEVPTRWRDVDGSKVRLVEGAIKMLFAVMRLRLRHSRFSGAVPAFDALLGTRPIGAPAPDPHG
jgi:glycosyltransferase involved in cell wall biosynthesis